MYIVQYIGKFFNFPEKNNVFTFQMGFYMQIFFCEFFFFFILINRYNAVYMHTHTLGLYVENTIFSFIKMNNKITFFFSVV